MGESTSLRVRVGAVVLGRGGGGGDRVELTPQPPGQGGSAEGRRARERGEGFEEGSVHK